MAPTSLPIPAPIFKKSDFDDESLPLLNQWVAGVAQYLNALAGHAGPIQLQDHIDLQGNRLINVGAPASPSDGVSVAFGAKNYGPAAIRPHLEAMGKTMFSSYRRLSDQVQQEKYSTFLNGVLNTAPTSNTANILFGVAGGGSVTASISSGLHQRVDNSQVPFSPFNDTLTLPTSWPISSLTRLANIGTAVTTVPNTLVGGQNFTIVSPTDPSFAGVFVVQSVTSPTTFKFQQFGPDVAVGAAGGDISLGGVYYYTLTRGQNVLGRTGPFDSDSWSNRVAASNDGTTIVAVVVVNSGGGDTINSAAGATAPTTGAAVAVIRRL